MTRCANCTCAQCAPPGTPTPLDDAIAAWEKETGRPWNSATRAEHGDVVTKAIIDGLNRHTSNIPDDEIFTIPPRKTH